MSEAPVQEADQLSVGQRREGRGPGPGQQEAAGHLLLHAVAGPGHEAPAAAQQRRPPVGVQVEQRGQGGGCGGVAVVFVMVWCGVLRCVVWFVCLFACLLCLFV